MVLGLVAAQVRVPLEQARALEVAVLELAVVLVLGSALLESVKEQELALAPRVELESVLV